jgi:hypothetical protein
VRPANASTPEIAYGNIISQVIANASAILNRSGIFGLIVVILARIDTNDYSCIDLSYISIFKHREVNT